MLVDAVMAWDGGSAVPCFFGGGVIVWTDVFTCLSGVPLNLT